MKKIIPNTKNLYSCDKLGNIYREEGYTNQLRKLRSGEIKNVKVFTKGKKLKPYVGNVGYPVVNIFNKVNYVHKLIMNTFIGESNGLTVNHKNGIKTDNKLENLEYLSYSENNEHARKTGLNKINISDFTIRYPVIAYKDNIKIGEYKSASDAAKKLKVYHVTCICKGIRKSSKGYTFKYKNDSK